MGGLAISADLDPPPKSSESLAVSLQAHNPRRAHVYPHVATDALYPGHVVVLWLAPGLVRTGFSCASARNTTGNCWARALFQRLRPSPSSLLEAGPPNFDARRTRGGGKKPFSYTQHCSIFWDVRPHASFRPILSFSSSCAVRRTSKGPFQRKGSLGRVVLGVQLVSSILMMGWLRGEGKGTNPHTCSTRRRLVDKEASRTMPPPPRALGHCPPPFALPPRATLGLLKLGHRNTPPAKP